MACWLLGIFVLVETKWFYEMINLMTVITGYVQLTSAENEGRSGLDLFLKIQNPNVALALHHLPVVD